MAAASAGLLIVLLVLDFLFYLLHVAKHRWTWLWRLHETHHSSEQLDFLAATADVRQADAVTVLFAHEQELGAISVVLWMQIFHTLASVADHAENTADFLRVMLAKKDLAEENEIIAAKALEGTQKKKRANKPNEFITNDDFCPGCGLQLKNMPESEMSFWTEIFQRELGDNDDPNAMMAMGMRQFKPGVLMFRGWGLETRVGSESQARLKSLQSGVDALRKKLEARYPFIHGVKDADSPQDLQLHHRGDPVNLVGPGIPRHFLTVLAPGDPKPFSKGSGRFELADAVVSHPLTARVIVNRIWQQHFGQGLVGTTSDFGKLGDSPTHPELLDWLAGWFIENGWSIKKLQRLIVTSATYRQDSRVTTDLLEKDPENRLLARGPRLRLPAEMIRDQALFVSGLLVEKLGGPSVRPYQPEGLYKDMVFSNMTAYDQDRGEGLWRRSLYTFWKRTVMPPAMHVFDASARESCTVREPRTNTPLQALNLMNDVTYVEAARLLAERMIKEGGATPESRIDWAFRVATARRPDESERRILLGNLNAQLDHFRRHPGEAAGLLSVGEKRNDANLSAAELAAYSVTASLLLNLDEVITKQ